MLKIINKIYSQNFRVYKCIEFFKLAQKTSLLRDVIISEMIGKMIDINVIK